MSTEWDSGYDDEHFRQLQIVSDRGYGSSIYAWIFGTSEGVEVPLSWDQTVAAAAALLDMAPDDLNRRITSA